MKKILLLLQLTTFFTLSSAMATFLPVSEQEIQANCYEGSPMIFSDICFGKTYNGDQVPFNGAEQILLSENYPRHIYLPQNNMDTMCIRGFMNSQQCQFHKMTSGFYYQNTMSPFAQSRPYTGEVYPTYIMNDPREYSLKYNPVYHPQGNQFHNYPRYQASHL